MKKRCSSAGDDIPNSVALIEAHIPALRHFARALLHGDVDRADDLVQDCLERALLHWGQRRPDGNLRNWLYTILYNCFVTERRRQRRHIWCSIFTDGLEQDLPRIEGGQDGVLAYRDLLRGFSELPDAQRSVLFLIAVEDFTYAEAAGVLGVPIGTVMSRLSRGRERLRQYMYGSGGETPVRRRIATSQVRSTRTRTMLLPVGIT